MHILAIDPGSTSTKIGIFRQSHLIKKTLTHPRKEIEKFKQIADQYDYRLGCIQECLVKEGLAEVPFDAVVGRGGLIKPLEGGIYLVNQAMVRDLQAAVGGQHAANLGGLLALSFADLHRCHAYVVDPPVIDELWPPARLSGFAEIERRSLFHALNQKASARATAEELGIKYESSNLIVVHMGGGITVGAHCGGRVVDVNNGLSGDGPFSPERTGGLPLDGVFRLLSEGRYSIAELQEIVSRRGGVYSYLGTVEMSEVENRIERGEVKARFVLDAMIYQIAKEVGGLAAALDGKVDAIVLTGGMAHSQYITQRLRQKVCFIAQVCIRPGECEIEALIDGVRRVWDGIEEAKEYKGDG